MSLKQFVKLSSGASMPLLGFGTWQSAPGVVKNCIIESLKAGYIHFDLAKVYGNQKEIAEGFREGFKATGLKREDVFITSKLWNSQHRPEDVPKALDDCLAELQLDYLDLYLIHFPCSFKNPPGANPNQDLFPIDKAYSEKVGSEQVAIDDSTSIVDTWEAMVALPKEKVRTVGVSNFAVAHLDAVTKATGKAPAVNQVEMHLRLQDDELLQYCKEHNIHLTAYSPLGNNMINEPLLVANEDVKKLAEAQKVTPAQLLLAWVIKRGASVIPKSVSASRIKENFQQVEITDEVFEKLNKIGAASPARFNIPCSANEPAWPINMFGTPEEKNCPHKVIL